MSASSALGPGRIDSPAASSAEWSDMGTGDRQAQAGRCQVSSSHDEIASLPAQRRDKGARRQQTNAMGPATYRVFTLPAKPARSLPLTSCEHAVEGIEDADNDHRVCGPC